MLVFVCIYLAACLTGFVLSLVQKDCRGVDYDYSFKIEPITAENWYGRAAGNFLFWQGIYLFFIVYCALFYLFFVKLMARDSMDYYKFAAKNKQLINGKPINL